MIILSAKLALVLLFTVLGYLVTTKWDKSVKLPILIIAAISALILSESTDFISHWLYLPSVNVSLESDDNAIIMEIENGNTPIENLAVDLRLSGKFIKLEYLSSYTEAGPPQVRMSDAVVKVLSEGSHSSTRYNVANNIEILIPNVTSRAKIRYKLYVQGQDKNFYFAGDDRFRITYAWLFNGHKQTKEEFISIADGSKVGAPAIKWLSPPVAIQKSKNMTAEMHFRINDMEALKNNKDGVIISDLSEEYIRAIDMAEAIKSKSYLKGREYAFKGDLSRAIDEFNNVLRIKPDYYEALVDKATALGELGRFKESNETYDQAIKIKSNDSFVWYNKGAVLTNLKRYSKAILAFDKAIKLAPNNYQAWLRKGHSLIKQKRYKEAIKAYDKAIIINPESYSAWYNKGICLFESDQYEASIQAYDRALMIKPDYSTAFAEKARTLGVLNRFKESIEAANQAIKIKSDDYLAWMIKGGMLHNLKRYSQAILAFDKVIAQAPHDYAAWLHKGHSLIQQKRYKEAIKVYDKAISINPESYSPWLNKGICLFESEQYEASIQAYDRALMIKPRDIVAITNKKIAQSRLNPNF